MVVICALIADVGLAQQIPLNAVVTKLTSTLCHLDDEFARLDLELRVKLTNQTAKPVRLYRVLERRAFGLRVGRTMDELSTNPTRIDLGAEFPSAVIENFADGDFVQLKPTDSYVMTVWARIWVPVKLKTGFPDSFLLPGKYWMTARFAPWPLGGIEPSVPVGLKRNLWLGTLTSEPIQLTVPATSPQDCE